MFEISSYANILSVMKTIQKPFLLLALTLVLVSTSFMIKACCSKFYPDRNNKLKIELFTAEKEIKAVKDYLNTLTLEEMAAQIFLVNIGGNSTFYPAENYNGKSLIPGGYLFFSFNLANSPEKIVAFTESITQFCQNNSQLAPFLAIDQEGGLVNRLKYITSPFPSNQLVAANLHPEQANEMYRYQAEQMKCLGFHMNLSPVAEASNPANSVFLDTRSFGSIDETILFSKAQIYSFQTQDVSCVVKHFPGNTNTDPHSGLPRFNVNKAFFENNFLSPFREILEAGPDAVLLSHAIVPQYDENPADLSEYWIRSVLRNDYKYHGLTISDDILMGALEKNGYPAEEAVIKAVESGIDVIMLSQKNFSFLLDILLNKAEEDKEFVKKIYESAYHVICYKIKAGLLRFEKNKDGTFYLTPCYNHKNSQNLPDFYRSKDLGQRFYMEHFQQ